MRTELNIEKDNKDVYQNVTFTKLPKLIEVGGVREIKRSKVEPREIYYILSLDEAKELRDFLNQLEL